MNKLSKICSIIAIVLSSIALLSFVYLCIVKQFEFRWLITALFCISLIIINVTDLRNGGKNG